MTKYRIIESIEPDGTWYKVQQRWLFIWWTLRFASSFHQAKVYLAQEKNYYDNPNEKVTVLYEE